MALVADKGIVLEKNISLLITQNSLCNWHWIGDFEFPATIFPFGVNRAHKKYVSS
jgi:hypothetical protein